MNKIEKIVVILVSFMVAVGCSSTPRIRSVRSVTELGTYGYGQNPEQRQLEYRGPEYKHHLRVLARMGYQHEEALAADEYQVKEAIAQAELRRQAEAKGIKFPDRLPPTTTYYYAPQRQWGQPSRPDWNQYQSPTWYGSGYGGSYGTYSNAGAGYGGGSVGATPNVPLGPVGATPNVPLGPVGATPNVPLGPIGATPNAPMWP